LNTNDILKLIARRKGFGLHPLAEGRGFSPAMINFVAVIEDED